MTKKSIQKNHIVLFHEREIRRTLYQNEWWYVVADVITALIETVNSTDYIKKMRSRDEELSKGWGQIVTPLI